MRYNIEINIAIINGYWAFKILVKKPPIYLGGFLLSFYSFHDSLKLEIFYQVIV